MERYTVTQKAYQLYKQHVSSKATHLIHAENWVKMVIPNAQLLEHKGVIKKYLYKNLVITTDMYTVTDIKPSGEILMKAMQKDVSLTKEEEQVRKENNQKKEGQAMQPEKIVISPHAHERYEERVSRRRAEVDEVKKWAMMALSKSTHVGSSGNRDKYRYKNFEIITEGRNLITISYYNGENPGELTIEVQDNIRKLLERKIEPFRQQHIKLQVKYHELMIEYLQAKRKKRPLLKHDIDMTKAEMIECEADIRNIDRTAGKYNVEVDMSFMQHDIIF